MAKRPDWLFGEGEDVCPDRRFDQEVEIKDYILAQERQIKRLKIENRTLKGCIEELRK